jgi:hypothetical protein
VSLAQFIVVKAFGIGIIRMEEENGFELGPKSTVSGYDFSLSCLHAFVTFLNNLKHLCFLSLY